MFSPLALTQTLPFLPLAQGDIDYQVDRRDEPDLFDTLFADPTTKVILVRNGRLAVPRGQGAVVDYTAAKMRLSTLPGAYMASCLHDHPEAVAIFLGSYGAARGEHVVAVDVTRLRTAGQSPADSAQLSADAAFESDDENDGESTTMGGAGKPDLLAQAVERFDWVDLRGFAAHANAREAGQATSASTLSMWHAGQRFCPACGAPVEPAMAGWAQRCTGKDDGRRLLFPRIEPAVITAIVDGSDRLLLQHNKAWRNPLLYSVCAGFVEAGENLEHAVRREAHEETGLRLGEVRYLGSQPWPFPASLMMAFKAQALDADIHVDGEETQTARWVTRDEYTQELISGRMQAPGKATIARYMIEEWYGREL
ncbi:NAD(+) diphosphatase [Bifidobacterium leontopitheci]|uniref:NAD(+) diphosphatase n=1 Tax=Bifidobacterium leontopitheci TaxID=2650774 RepID=A0A6I1GM28_9BIFI|nr:NAD(+) diphosphatase [Bifidobacterium leontopitheci]KAB7790449.1 NADH pyrophosphatase [Bifidobacterium leontopitheci]